MSYVCHHSDTSLYQKVYGTCANTYMCSGLCDHTVTILKFACLILLSISVSLDAHRIYLFLNISLCQCLSISIEILAFLSTTGLSRDTSSTC